MPSLPTYTNDTCSFSNQHLQNAAYFRWAIPFKPRMFPNIIAHIASATNVTPNSLPATVQIMIQLSTRQQEGPYPVNLCAFRIHLVWCSTNPLYVTQHSIRIH